ncbi:hypothetical protein EB155_12020, partial [archaeon]|nr:hypothetical protein [archaeon]
ELDSTIDTGLDEILSGGNFEQFIDASIMGDPITNEHERDLIIWNDRQSFSLANLIEDDSLYERLDTHRGKRLLDDFSMHTAVITNELPYIIIRPELDSTIDTGLDEILSGGNFEQFIDASFSVNDYSDSMVDKLIHNLFEDLSREANDPEIKLINRPNEYANTALKGNETFIDTIITAEHFEKFIDSSMKDQELFSHININPFAELRTDANSISVENILINRPNEYANTALKGNETFIDTILKGGYYEKFIDSSATVCSELYQYNNAKVMNVVLKDVSKIPWFSTNSSNVNVSTPLNNAWSFSTNSSNTSQTNTIVFFSTAGPDYQVDLTPTYIDMALATSIANANNGFLTANGWQYIDQKDPLPLDTNTLGFESNRTIQAAMFEKIEFVITDIANTHNGYYFAVGTSPWFDDNREANVMFG